MTALRNGALGFLPSEFRKFLSWEYMLIRDINDKITLGQSEPEKRIIDPSDEKPKPIAYWINKRRTELLSKLRNVQKMLEDLKNTNWKNYRKVLRNVPQIK
ncbi:MAG: hypothetical protein ACETVN_01220 [Asgard group archaeon]